MDIELEQFTRKHVTLANCLSQEGTRLEDHHGSEEHHLASYYSRQFICIRMYLIDIDNIIQY